MKKTTFIILLIGILGVIVLSWLYGFSTGPHYERCWKAFYYCSRIGIAVSFLPSLFLALSLLRDQKTTGANRHLTSFDPLKVPGR